MSARFSEKVFWIPISFLGNLIFVFGSTHYLDSLYWVERVEHWLTQNRPTCILNETYWCKIYIVALRRYYK